MPKLFALGFFSTYLCATIALPALAQAPKPATACRLSYSSMIPNVGLKFSLTDERIKLSRMERQSDIAIEFLRANRPDRAAQINQTLHRESKLSPANFTVLEIIQYLRAGKLNAAIDRLSKLEEGAYLLAITDELKTLTLLQRKEWVIAAVDRLSFDSEATHWLLNLAEDYYAAGNSVEAINLLDKATSRFDLQTFFRQVRLANYYQKFGNPTSARSMIEPLVNQIPIDHDPIFPLESTEALIAIGHQFALLGDTEKALSYLERAATQFPKFQYDISLLHQQLSLAYAAAGESQKAIAQLNALQGSSELQDIAYRELAQQSSELGNIRLTVQVLQLLKNRIEIPPRIVESIARTRNVDAAQQIIPLLPSNWHRLSAWAIVLTPLPESEVSTKILSQMQKIETASNSNVSMLNVAEALIDAGDRIHVRKILEELKQLAQTSNNLNLKLALSRKYAEIEDFKQASQLITVSAQEIPSQNLIPEESLRIKPWISLKFGRSPLEKLMNAPVYIPIPAPLPRVKQLAKPNNLKQSQPIPTPTVPNGIIPAPKLDEDRLALNRAILIRRSAQARNFIQASELLKQIPDHYCDLKGYSMLDIVPAAVQAGQLEFALDMVQNGDRLLKLADDRDLGKIQRQLIAIARAYSDRNQFPEAIRLLETALAL